MKKNKPMIIAFVTPAVLSFVLMFLYPVIRTVVMSFYKVENITSATKDWSFYGFENYINIWSSQAFRTSMMNMLKIWFFGGVIVLALALIFAVILTSGVRGKGFFRAAIYMPNIISAVALATMWIQYVFNIKFGLLKSVFEALGMESAAAINWLDSDMKFWAMLIAFIFGAVGYYMLIFLSGIERIPADLYEAATIDGANKIEQFKSITLPLLKGVFKTNLTFWSVHTISFFVWSKMFSPIDKDMSTMSPVIYMYDLVFGSKGNTARDAGGGAAVGVMLALCVLLVFFLFNKFIKEENVEF